MIDVVGIAGYARSGKDTVAKHFISQFEFERVAFADTLRKAAYALNPIIAVEPEYLGFDEWQNNLIYLQDIIDRYGWDGYKTTEYSDEIRRILQRLGTDVGRDIVGADIWVESTLDTLPGKRYVVTDVRFPNEANYIRERFDGIIIRIERPGIGPINNHPSEIALDDYDFDHIIENDGSQEDLQQKVIEIYEDRNNDLKIAESAMDKWGINDSCRS